MINQLQLQASPPSPKAGPFAMVSVKSKHTLQTKSLTSTLILLLNLPIQRHPGTDPAASNTTSPSSDRPIPNSPPKSRQPNTQKKKKEKNTSTKRKRNADIPPTRIYTSLCCKN